MGNLGEFRACHGIKHGLEGGIRGWDLDTGLRGFIISGGPFRVQSELLGFDPNLI